MESVLIYVLVFLSVFLINVIAGKIYSTKRKLSNFLIFVGFSILLIFVGCRYYVGTDYESYIDLYNTIATLDFSELYLVNMEIGPKLLFKLIYILFDNQYFIFIGLAFLSLYPLYKSNKLYDYKYLGYSILTYCFMFLPFSMNGMRQGVAMSFLVLSFVYLFKDKKINSLIVFIIAFLFHKSAILILPYLLLFMFNKGKSAEAYSILITMVLSVLLLFFNSAMLKIGIVSDYEYMIGGLDIDNMSFKSLFLFIPFIIIMISYNNKVEKNNDELNGLVISGLILTLIGTTKQFLSRISLYHLMFLILLMPLLINNIKNNTNKIIVKIFFILYLILYFVYECYFQGKHEIFPYQTWIWEVI